MPTDLGLPNAIQRPNGGSDERFKDPTEESMNAPSVAHGRRESSPRQGAGGGV